MRVLVTGGSGFIGAPIVAELQRRGHDVDSFDRRDGGDVRDDYAVMRAVAGHDVVVHLAGVLGTAELLDSLHDAIAVNVNGTVNVLAAARDADARYVGITMPDCWPSAYQATKLAAVRLAKAYENAYDLPVIHVRTFNVYGPGQAYGEGHPQKILPTFAVAAHQGKPLPIWGNGRNTADLVHVADVARTFAEVVEWGDRPLTVDTVDCGSGEQTRVIDFAQQVCDAAGTPLLVDYLPMRAGELPGTYLAAEEFGPFTRPGFHLTDPRFVEAVEWYRRFA